MGKGEDFDYFEAASAAVVVGLSNIVGLINTNRPIFRKLTIRKIKEARDDIDDIIFPMD